MKTNGWQESDDEQPQGRQKAYAGTDAYVIHTADWRGRD